MPKLDFAVICDYVRAEGGVAHVIAGGIDTIYAKDVPTQQNIGIWARIMVARNECGRPHRLEVLFQDEDGERLAEISGPFIAEWPEGHPVGWEVGWGVALNIGLPLPRYGRYSMEIMLNDSLVKAIPLRVMRKNSGD